MLALCESRLHLIMRSNNEFPWQFFWLLEVVFIAAPMFIAIVVFQRSDPVLTPHRLAVLFAVLIGLTVLNAIFCKLWGARAPSARRRHTKTKSQSAGTQAGRKV
jgi:hypothetical protein